MNLLRQSLLRQTRLGIRNVSTSSKTGIDLQRPVQSYISRSSDPYINLSIEHYLLQKSHPDSAVLFLYVNRPSIILGRNQNPWLEVNLGLLKAARNRSTPRPQTEPSGLGDVDLVRRRSGGGTVFHDEGNVNWTVICPPAKFTRDKHAEMVVRALRGCGIQRSRVNERHDIVLDQGQADHNGTWGPGDDTHSTPWQTNDSSGPRPLKVSGSAYKLTKARALHHGTCLLSSPNLNVIPDYLHSPAKLYIKGRGVESVSSPVGNIMLDNDRFIKTVQQAFSDMYTAKNLSPVALGDGALGIPEVQKGYLELKSHEWTYLQTPQFTFSDTPANAESDAPQDQPRSLQSKIELVVRSGAITESHLRLGGVAAQESDCLRQLLAKRSLHEIRDWTAIFAEAGIRTDDSAVLARWIQDMLPPPGADEGG